MVPERKKEFEAQHRKASEEKSAKVAAAWSKYKAAEAEIGRKMSELKAAARREREGADAVAERDCTALVAQAFYEALED